jgi:hypothetical protein
MRRLAILLALLIPAPSLAATTLLLVFDDIGAPEADFSWNEVYGGGVELSANHPRCWGEDCYGFHSTGSLEGFRLVSRDVYYVGDGDRRPVLCGKTRGFLGAPRFYAACRVRVEPERVCEAWYGEDDCVDAGTRYRVYLHIEEPAGAPHASAP